MTRTVTAGGFQSLLLALCAFGLMGCAEPLDFEHPWVLVVGGLLLTGLALWQRRAPSPRLAYSHVALVRATGRGLRARLAGGPAVLRGIALVALVIGCARPQWESFDDRLVEGIDLFLVLDMSGSMRAVDLPAEQLRAYQAQYRRDPPNRFENAIVTLQRFVDGRERDRIGMVVFARDAFLQFPLTLDYGTIQTLLERLRLDAIDASATAIGNALGLGVRGLMNSDAQSRAIILITDGKQQGGNISPMRAAEIAADEGIRFYPILVGREGPALVPTNFRNGDGTSRFRQEDYPVDPELLAEIAARTQGRFYRAERPESLENELNAILDELERTRMQDVASVNERELFPFAIWLALAALLAEAMLRWLYIRRLP